MCGLVAILLVSGAAHALRLRPSRGSDNDVNVTAAIAQDGYLVDLGGDAGDTVPVPETASRELQLLVDFMHENAVDDVL